MNIKESLTRIKNTIDPVSKETQKLIVLLLAADMVFVVLHIIFKLGFTTDALFLVEMDWGYAEVYQYIKELWACILLLMLAASAARRPRLLYFAWAMLFMYLLLDDSLQLHERVGRKVSYFFNFQPPPIQHRPHTFPESFTPATNKQTTQHIFCQKEQMFANTYCVAKICPPIRFLFFKCLGF